MFRKLALASAIGALLAPAAIADGLSADDLADILNERYPNANLENVQIIGTEEGGDPFNYSYPGVEEITSTEAAKARDFKIKPAATPIHTTYGPCVGTVWHTDTAGYLFTMWCNNDRGTTWPQYEVKREYRYLFSNGDYVWIGSQLLDCGDPFDYAQMPPVVRVMGCG